LLYHVPMNELVSFSVIHQNGINTVQEEKNSIWRKSNHLRTYIGNKWLMVLSLLDQSSFLVQSCVDNFKSETFLKLFRGSLYWKLEKPNSYSLIMDSLGETIVSIPLPVVIATLITASIIWLWDSISATCLKYLSVSKLLVEISPHDE